MFKRNISEPISTFCAKFHDSNTLTWDIVHCLIIIIDSRPGCNHTHGWLPVGMYNNNNYYSSG